MGDALIGQINLVGFSFAPRGWAICNGAVIQIAQNTALFSLLGTAFGGDGRVTFKLPDLRGRIPTGIGTGPGLNNIAWGQTGGAENITLTTSTMPSHNHTIINPKLETGTGKASGSVAYLSSGNTYTNTTGGGNAAGVSATISNTGSGTSYNNVAPVLASLYVIALVGIYPSRN